LIRGELDQFEENESVMARGAELDGCAAIEANGEPLVGELNGFRGLQAGFGFEDKCRLIGGRPSGGVGN